MQERTFRNSAELVEYYRSSNTDTAPIVPQDKVGNSQDQTVNRSDKVNTAPYTISVEEWQQMLEDGSWKSSQ